MAWFRQVPSGQAELSQQYPQKPVSGRVFLWAALGGNDETDGGLCSPNHGQRL
jgi:hypothetical protein